MVTPPFLKHGDTIAIVSTARKITKTDLEPALELLASWGFKAVLGHTIGAEEHQFAGDDTLRTQDFQAMLDNPNIKAIWCARGGYGTARMLDGLNFSVFKKNPKWIIGYSDITVLHSHIHNFGIETLHAQMPLEIEKKTEEARKSILRVLSGKDHRITCTTINNKNRMGATAGTIVGGNLSVLYSLCGSSTALNTEGKILFIEDLEEYLYHIDRMLQNLKRNGMLKNLAALLVGGMTQMQDNAIPFGRSAYEIVTDVVREYHYPVCFDFPAGHIKDNRALILGREVQLNVEETLTTLIF
ncbi:MAG: LD-carboxypeptidase [Bacteroidetes bacterium]|nr:MAG: LD-carboxypeptidase [Bacteroidota bacterium]